MSGRRRYDHDEARRLRANGMPVSEIALRMGVSTNSIRYAVVPSEKERISEKQKRKHLRQGNRCVDCGKPITGRIGNKPPAKRCHGCASVARRLVTDTHMRCATCKQWKPDNEFFRDSSPPLADARRGRSNVCKACDVARRRALRHRNFQPCEGGCGKMVHSPKDTNAGTGMCVTCANRLTGQRRHEAWLAGAK